MAPSLDAAIIFVSHILRPIQSQVDSSWKIPQGTKGYTEPHILVPLGLHDTRFGHICPSTVLFPDRDLIDGEPFPKFQKLIRTVPQDSFTGTRDKFLRETAHCLGRSNKLFTWTYYRLLLRPKF